MSITINGNKLSKIEESTLRAAIIGFRMGLTTELHTPSFMYEHKGQMITIAQGYNALLEKIGRMFNEEIAK